MICELLLRVEIALGVVSLAKGTIDALAVFLGLLLLGWIIYWTEPLKTSPVETGVTEFAA